MQAVIRSLASLGRFGSRLGPYLMLEILMPGGTLIALLLFLYQRRNLRVGIWASRVAQTVEPVLESIGSLGRMGPVSLRSATLRSER